MSRGRFFVRVEHSEADFLAGLSRDVPLPFDGAIVSADYLAPFPDQDYRHAKRPDRLVDELAAHDAGWLLDPATAKLGHDLVEQRLRPRPANSPIAKAVALPLTPRLAFQTGEAEALIDAAAGVQLRSRMFTAPYLEVRGGDDPHLDANLRLLSLARERAGDRHLVAVLQTMSSYVRDGSAREAARALVAAGAETVLVRVRRLAPESAGTDDVVAYGRLIRVIGSAGAFAVADCVGRLGPVLVATGADGFSSGAYRFRTVPQDLCPTSGGGSSGVLMWEAPGRFASVPREMSDSMIGARTCGVPGCPSPAGGGSEIDVRVHNLHEFQRLASEAAALGLGLAPTLKRAGPGYPALWATALEQLQALAA
jgi:hypothetical protein